MMRLLTIPIVLVVLLLGAMVWSGGGVSKRADFTFINRGDIYTLDLNQLSYQQDFRLTYGIREGLYSPDPQTFRPVPGGATHYDLSEDKLTWTFHLRPEAKWSNGDPVTTKDYLFSWRRLLEEPGEYTYLFYYIRNAEAYEKSYAKGEPIDFKTVGVEAVDAHTLKVSLNNPVPYLLELLAFPPFYPRHERSMEPFKEPRNPKPNEKYSYRNEYTRPPHVVTNGPFNITNWEFRRRIWLEKNPLYWDKANVKSNSIELLVNENQLSQFLQYETGQVDWISEVLGNLGAELMEKGRTDMRVSPAFATMFMTLLCLPELPATLGGGKNPLADVRVRQALAMVIDKRFIVENVTRMGELPAKTYLPPDGTLPDFRWQPGVFEPERKEPYEFKELQAMLKDPAMDAKGPGIPRNIELARKLLAEAGYPNGVGFPALPLFFNTDSPVRPKICEALKNQWKEHLNIDLQLHGLEGKIYRERLSKRQYFIGPIAWYGDYPDASTFTDKYISTSLQNDSAWFNEDFDALCAAALKEPDATKRLEILGRAEHMIDTEIPIIPIYHYVNGSLRRDEVKGLLENPRNMTVFKAVHVERKK